MKRLYPVGIATAVAALMFSLLVTEAEAGRRHRRGGGCGGYSNCGGCNVSYNNCGGCNTGCNTGGCNIGGCNVAYSGGTTVNYPPAHAGSPSDQGLQAPAVPAPRGQIGPAAPGPSAAPPAPRASAPPPPPRQ